MPRKRREPILWDGFCDFIRVSLLSLGVREILQRARMFTYGASIGGVRVWSIACEVALARTDYPISSAVSSGDWPYVGWTPRAARFVATILART